ncbi:autotransporter-associated beta strand repeat-containing protein [Bosea sp. 2RAB26]|uniref:autotransporter-associated beta strand repeat-containing protein n=1 Tax=Bosea sp. 2RAB26 TaxID=3237476 RepID=UPI003F936814
MTTSRTCLTLALSLGAGLPLWPQGAVAQQIIQGGGDGRGYFFGAGGIAGGGGGLGGGGPFYGGAGGSAAQTPGGSASAGAAGIDDAGALGGAGGAPGAPNDLAAGGGGGGGAGFVDPGYPGFPYNGGVGGAGGAGLISAVTGTSQLTTNSAGSAGTVGSSGGVYAGGSGGGGGGLVLTGTGVAMNTNGFSVTGGAGGASVGLGDSGGGGAGLVLLNAGTVTVVAGAGGASAITGGSGGDGYNGGNGGAGLFLYNGGALSHQAGTITGGAGGGSGANGGRGGAGVLSNRGAIVNRASITGGKGGDSIGDGHAGAGIEAWGGTVANAATGLIAGGAGGAATNSNPVYSAGNGGTGVLFREGQTASLDNAGTIRGGNGGTVVAGSNFGRGGVGIVGAASGGISIVNSGSISGGLSGDGVRANAVELYGSNNRFEVQAGSNIVGNVVVAGGGTNNVFALGGTGSNSFNVVDLTSTYTGFTAFEKTGAGTWVLSSSTAAVTPWTVTHGTLSVSSDASLGDTAGALTLNGGTLQVTGSAFTSTTRNVVLGGDGGGFDIATANDVFVLFGSVTGPGRLSKTGAGWLSLNGVNSYSGGTTVSEGTLVVQATGALGTGSVTIDAAGAGSASMIFGTSASAGTLPISLANANSFLTFADSSSAGGAEIDNNGTVAFNDDSSAGNARIANDRRLYFGGNATAGHAVITATSAATHFSDNSTAGGATLINNAGSFLRFFDSSTAGSATINNNAGLAFLGGSTAGSATITNNASVNFAGTSTASSAMITNNAGSSVNFLDRSTAGSATIINNASLDFYDTSTAGDARLITAAAGSTSFNGTGPLGDGRVSAGSIEGAGSYSLRSLELTVGSNGLSTEVSGVISGAGGSLIKTGAGTLALSGTNTYSGATLVNAGSLIVNGSIASSTVSVGSGATLGGSGTIAGAVTIGSGGTLSAGNSPGTLTVRSLTLNSGSNTVFELNTPGVVGGATNDRIIVNGAGPSGNLQLGGTVTANVASAGYYRLFDVTRGGTISGSFDTLALSAPSVSGAAGTLYNAPSGSPTQVNLAVVGAGQNLQFWDGADRIGNGAVDGGSGTWNAGNTNWTKTPGEAGVNATWASSVGVFQGVAGAVTVAGTQDFDTLQFNSSGYVLNGDALRFGAVGGGTLNTAAGVTTTIGSALVDGIGTDLRKVGAGTLVLSGTSRYTGATLVSAGALIVDGSIASSSDLTVAAGATLAGSGQLPSTTVNGTLSPGNSPGMLTVNGNLVMGASSVYLAEIQGAIADRVNVTGIVSLAGTLQLAPLGGAYAFSTPYTLLSAARGLGGTAFGTVDTTGTFGDGVATTVSYTNNDVLLTLTPKPLTPDPKPPGSPELGVKAPRNAVAVAAGIDRAVANGGDPSSLFGIYNLPAASIPAAVNSLSGEADTAAPAMANVASDQFLRVMLDPTAMGRLGDAGAAGPGTAVFSGLVRKDADRPVGPSRLDMRFYSVWGSAYGSYGRTDGNVGIGSAKRTIDDAHLATGIDVRLQPGTIAGVAVSGGKARASLPGVLGKVDAEVFQAGLYGVTQLGPVRLGGALSYARLDNDVSRSIPALGSSLSSSYATTAWSGRLQASAALLHWNGLSLSPLAAIQATRARSPAVIEANWAGANAGALALARRSDITARSELGLQLDADTVLGGVAITGYARAAWAHYFRRDADLTASLIGLPGASFSATGAQADRNSALLSTGVMARLSERVSLGLNLDGELSANSTRLGGSAQLRVSF